MPGPGVIRILGQSLITFRSCLLKTMQLEVNLSLDHFLASWPCNQGIRWHQKTFCQNSWDFCQCNVWVKVSMGGHKGRPCVKSWFNKELVCETCKIMCLPYKKWWFSKMPREFDFIDKVQLRSCSHQMITYLVHVLVVLTCQIYKNIHSSYSSVGLVEVCAW